MELSDAQFADVWDRAARLNPTAEVMRGRKGEWGIVGTYAYVYVCLFWRKYFKFSLFIIIIIIIQVNVESFRIALES